MSAEDVIIELGDPRDSGPELVLRRRRLVRPWWILLAAALAVVAVLVPPGSAAPGYRFGPPVWTVPGGEFAQLVQGSIVAIDSDGLLVVRDPLTGTTRWTDNTTMRDSYAFSGGPGVVAIGNVWVPQLDAYGVRFAALATGATVGHAAGSVLAQIGTTADPLLLMGVSPLTGCAQPCLDLTAVSVANGAPRWSLPAQAGWTYVAENTDPSIVAFASDTGQLRIVDAVTGRVQRTVAVPPSDTSSGGGAALAIADGTAYTLRSEPDGRLALTATPLVPSGRSWSVNAAAPNGQQGLFVYLCDTWICVAGSATTLRFDARTGARFAGGDSSETVPLGHFLAAVGAYDADHGVTSYRLIDLTTGRVLASVEGTITPIDNPGDRALLLLQHNSAQTDGSDLAVFRSGALDVIGSVGRVDNCFAGDTLVYCSGVTVTDTSVERMLTAWRLPP